MITRSVSEEFRLTNHNPKRERGIRLLVPGLRYGLRKVYAKALRLKVIVNAIE